MHQKPHNDRAGRAILILGAACVAVLLVQGCTRERPRQRFVARVDGVELSAQDLAAAIDTAQVGIAGTRSYINDWITNEILYQEAVRRGVAATDEFRRRVEDARRRMAVSEFLEHELSLQDTSGVSDQILRASYDSSASQYTLREDVVNASIVFFGDRDVANSFRSRVLRGTPWPGALEQVQQDTVARLQLLEVRSDRYFTHPQMYPEELWKLARALKPGEVSFVMKTDAGYAVLQLHSIRRQGEPPEFGYVRNEIRDRFLVDARRKRYAGLIASLRARHTIEVLLDSAGTATAQGGGQQ